MWTYAKLEENNLNFFLLFIQMQGWSRRRSPAAPTVDDVVLLPNQGLLCLPASLKSWREGARQIKWLPSHRTSPLASVHSLTRRPRATAI